MKVVTSYPQPTREVRHFEIPMSDGCRLAARMWLPVDAQAHPVPAVLEYIPYRKNDMTAARDAVSHPYVAGHGYACVRVDLRGTGDSEGLMLDEYLQQELDDGCEVIEWLASQPWCNGNVGMIGISWGGFNGLQIAAMRPPALKAVITCSSTVDRYADDVHYMGGTLLIDNLSWASIMFNHNTMPPDPQNKPDNWRELWELRLKNSGLWLKNWLGHQRRDEFWKHGSVCENYAAIQCPVYAVSGWADGYCRTVFHLMRNLDVPRKGLVGPWAHTYPHIGQPEPAIGFLQESIRWWDQWLKGQDSGIMEEPMLQLFMQGHAQPQSSYSRREGRWICEPSWPSLNVTERLFHLGANGLLAPEIDTEPEKSLSVNSPLSVGLHGGKWCSYAVPGDQPVDQRSDDAGSLVFETRVLETDLEILGAARLEITFSCDQPVAQVAARLSDIAPNGTATRVSYGLLNLTHRDSHEHPTPLVPGKTYQATVHFKHVAQCFNAGHRLRLSISTSYFPLAWPTPEPTTLTIESAKCHLDLPVRSPCTDDRRAGNFMTVEGAPPLEIEHLEEAPKTWRVIEDLASDTVNLEIQDGVGTVRFVESNLTASTHGTENYSFQTNSHDSVTGTARWVIGMSREDWQIHTVTQTTLSSSPTHFHIHAQLEAWAGEQLVHDAQWDEDIPRDLL